jgi:uncharacterized membrane protein
MVAGEGVGARVAVALGVALGAEGFAVDAEDGALAGPPEDGDAAPPLHAATTTPTTRAASIFIGRLLIDTTSTGESPSIRRGWTSEVRNPPRGTVLPSRVAGMRSSQETVMSGARSTGARHRHPVNQKLDDDAPLGARIADHATRILGSWKFIVLQTVVVVIWLVINVGFITGLIPFDPYPFILLNLAFSTQAAYAAPLILLATNRSADRDRLTLEHAAEEGDIEEKQNDRLIRGNTEILRHIEALEMQILSLEGKIVGLLSPGGADAPNS